MSVMELMFRGFGSVGPGRALRILSTRRAKPDLRVYSLGHVMTLTSKKRRRPLGL